MMTLDAAIQQLRSDPAHQALVKHAYLGADVHDSAERFSNSSEFAAVRRLLGGHIEGATILDVGAGVGIASYALAQNGARQVYALEPDCSDLVGLGAMRRLIANLPITPLQAVAEAIPLPKESVDMVYARQVLHHMADLHGALKEIARVLKPDGYFLACREHVIRAGDLPAFLQAHVVHQMAGGEHAFELDTYRDAITQGGLHLTDVWGTFESIINYTPTEAHERIQRENEHKYHNMNRLERRLARLPFVKQWLLAHGDAYYPGNMYTFMAHKRDA